MLPRVWICWLRWLWSDVWISMRRTHRSLSVRYYDTIKFPETVISPRCDHVTTTFDDAENEYIASGGHAH